jgi:hypothetical protein
MPSFNMRVHGIAVSTSDRSLHVFGVLPNGSPQVLRVSVDGKPMMRRSGLVAGLRDAPRRDTTFNKKVEDLWLVDGTGKGVLHFRKTGDALPDEVFSGVRIGAESFPRFLLSDQLLISLDEEPRAIWATGKGGGTGSTAMDCLAVRAYCWLGDAANVLLRDDAGRHVLVGKLPSDAIVSGGAVDLFADPKDGSAWVFMRRAGRLVQIDTKGKVSRQVQLAPPGSGRTVIADDLDRRAIWFTRVGADSITSLLRIDVDAPDLRPTVVSPDVPASSWMVPDLTGGVWMVGDEWIHRLNGRGEGIVGFRLNLPDSR